MSGNKVCVFYLLCTCEYVIQDRKFKLQLILAIIEAMVCMAVQGIMIFIFAFFQYLEHLVILRFSFVLLDQIKTTEK